jgi:hypothetical protein
VSIKIQLRGSKNPIYTSGGRLPPILRGRGGSPLEAYLLIKKGSSIPKIGQKGLFPCLFRKILV